MLPNNVVVQETPGGAIEIAAIDPVASMAAIENPRLKPAAERVREKLQKSNCQPLNAAVVCCHEGVSAHTPVFIQSLSCVPQIIPLAGELAAKCDRAIDR